MSAFGNANLLTTVQSSSSIEKKYQLNISILVTCTLAVSMKNELLKAPTWVGLKSKGCNNPTMYVLYRTVCTGSCFI